MYVAYTPEMTFESLTETLKKELPQYKVSLKKNPIAGFQYVEVAKSGAVGVWVRVWPAKKQVGLTRCHPSPLVRALLGGLLVLAFTWGSMGKVQKDCADVLKRVYKV